MTLVQPQNIVKQTRRSLKTLRDIIYSSFMLWRHLAGSWTKWLETVPINSTNTCLWRSQSESGEELWQSRRRQCGFSLRGRTEEFAYFVNVWQREVVDTWWLRSETSGGRGNGHKCNWRCTAEVFGGPDPNPTTTGGGFIFSSTLLSPWRWGLATPISGRHVSIWFNFYLLYALVIVLIDNTQ